MSDWHQAHLREHLEVVAAPGYGGDRWYQHLEFWALHAVGLRRVAKRRRFQRKIKRAQVLAGLMSAHILEHEEALSALSNTEQAQGG